MEEVYLSFYIGVIGNIISILLFLSPIDILVTQLAVEGEARISAVGFMGAGLNIIMYGSPLAAMRTVVRSKSVEYMPFLLSFFIFVNAGVWSLYAFLLRDYILGVPNGTGFLLGLAQLMLYAIYRNSKTSKNATTATVNGLEEGWQHEHLIISSSNHQLLHEKS